ncbi:MAG: hypothetical protein KY441_05910 [Actinobacteria bacterium]|nr:hypothetical protein [Actinomycetota bacterium]
MRKPFLFAATALAMVGLTGTAVAQPSNDDFDSATAVVEPLPFTDSISTIDATPTADDPHCAGTGATVWYSYTPSADSFIEANTFGSDYDTTLSVYTGDRGALSQIACNDDAQGLQSSVTWEAVAGTTYHLMAGSYFGGPGGNLSFTVQQGEAPPPPPPPPTPLEIDVIVDETGSVDPRTGVATISGTVTCSEPTFVWFSGELRQRVGRQVISGSFSDFVECDGETPWSATVEGDGIFAGGRAQVRTDAFGCSWTSCDDDQTTADIRLRVVRS